MQTLGSLLGPKESNSAEISVWFICKLESEKHPSRVGAFYLDCSLE